LIITKNSQRSFKHKFFGGPSGIRTQDTGIKSPLL
jgi:hypothetical protein